MPSPSSSSSRPTSVRPSTIARSLCLIAVASSRYRSSHRGCVVVAGFAVVPRTEQLTVITGVRTAARRCDDLDGPGTPHQRRQEHRRRGGGWEKPCSALRDRNNEEGHGDGEGATTRFSTESHTLNTARIRGMLSDADFERRQAVHETIISLRRQLPRLLSDPISFESGSADAYSADTTVVIGGSNTNETKQILVCSSRGELVDVSQAMVTFVTAVSRTSRFLESALGGGGGGVFGGAVDDRAKSANHQRSVPSFLDCRIVIDPNTTLDELRVDWSARWNAPPLPAGGGEESVDENTSREGKAAPTSVVLKGSSRLLLSQDGKVRQHQVEQVSLNERKLDGAAIGTFLSDARESVRNFQQSPIYGFLASAALGATSSSSGGGRGSRGNGKPGAGEDISGATASPINPFAPLLNQIRDEVFQQVSSAFVGPPKSGSTASPNDKVVPAPVYVISSVLGSSNINSSDKHTFLEDDRGLLLQLDGADAPHFTLQGPDGAYPLPGTAAWSLYAKAHRMVVKFVNEAIPVLADRRAHGVSDGMYPIPTMESLFNPDCRYCVRGPSDSPMDGVNLNQTVSTSSFAAVPLLRTPRKVARLYDVMASWRRRFTGSDWSLESVEILDWKSGSFTRVRVRYRSRLVVSSLPGLSMPLLGTATTDTEVRVTGADVYIVNDQGRIVQVLQEELRINDGSLRDGQLFTKNLCSAIEAGGSLGDDWWTAGIARLIFGGETNGQASGSGEIISAVPDSQTFSDEAAATAFRVMEALVREVPLSLPSSGSSNPPAAQYMMDNVRLVGYLNETLIRGRASYETSWNLAVASYTTAVSSNRIEAAPAKPVTVSVEWTSNRNIRLTAEVRLLVKPVLGLPMSPPLPAPEAVSFPLRLRAVSEYVLDPTSGGRIAAHRLVETKINDQLAPGDVVARWIQQLTMMGSMGRAGTDAGGGDGADILPPRFVENSLLQWLGLSGSAR